MELQKNLDAILKGAVEAGDVPGVVVALCENKSMLYEGAFGKRGLKRTDDMTTDSVFALASMTKTVTAIAVMQLVEQGKVDLDSPASFWVPYLARVKVLEGFDGQGKPLLRPLRRSITVRHLLTHTAGFAYEAWNADLIRYQEATETPNLYSNTEGYLKCPVFFDPGERWQYGIGMNWVAKLVENASGLKFGVYLRQNIFNPLGMMLTAHKYTPEMGAVNTSLHNREADGSLTMKGGDQGNQDLDFESGGGGLFSTAGDYLKLCQMILNRGAGPDGRRVLRTETVGLMMRNAIGDLRVTALKSVESHISNDMDFFPGIRKTWGLSWMINEEIAPTGRSAGSLFWGGLLNTYFWIDPQKNIAGVYLTQILPFCDIKALPLFYAVEKTVYDTLPQ
ncbi:MAG: beta-lactamase family protein [Desulfovibrio sp.]|jgi:CubicO group peptidase (beta-lactamase class C family)|nr:beta-lactamase family protein [Desulfovibrio sp.]